MSDIPNSDGLSGSLFLFTLPNTGSQNPTIVRTNVGRIDYVNGIIIINAVNVISGIEKDGQQVIEIQATPTSNDIVGLQDLYLQLDINNSSFEMISDQIASGIDPSASNYIVSSSYTRGNLVREGQPVVATTSSVCRSNWELNQHLPVKVNNLRPHLHRQPHPLHQLHPLRQLDLLDLLDLQVHRHQHHPLVEVVVMAAVINSRSRYKK